MPAEFFVHRQIRGKGACRCCQRPVQEPVEPQIIDKGVPTAGLVAHTQVAHFVDHLPYYRLEQINARSGVPTPRSALASWSGAGGASLAPLLKAHRDFVLSAEVLHADETPVRLLDPSAGNTVIALNCAPYRRRVFTLSLAIVSTYSYVDTILPGRGGRFKRTWPDGYFETSWSRPQLMLHGCQPRSAVPFGQLIDCSLPVVDKVVRWQMIPHNLALSWLLFRLQRSPLGPPEG